MRAGLKRGEDVLASEPVGGRSRATELPCLQFYLDESELIIVDIINLIS